jgi:L-ascorbate metabolism protein UlaG (beta-lactamase superfamily)
VSNGGRTARSFSAWQVPEGSIALWWLGQSGFAIRAGSTNLLLDPFLSHNKDRVTEAPISPEECGWVDAVACTHQHIDHFDQPTIEEIGRVAPRAKVVVPAPIVGMATAAGIAEEGVFGARVGEPIRLGDLTLVPVPAVHGLHMADAYTDGAEESGGLVRFMGYVVEGNGVRLYHAGDSLVFDGLVDLLKPMRIDVALLPINGRSFFREQQDLVGNMDERDAFELAEKIGAQLLIPMHYDAFPYNLGYPDHLLAIARDLQGTVSITVPDRTRPFLYAPGMALDP